jgi:hypothetical protein
MPYQVDLPSLLLLISEKRAAYKEMKGKVPRRVRKAALRELNTLIKRFNKSVGFQSLKIE